MTSNDYSDLQAVSAEESLKYTVAGPHKFSTLSKHSSQEKIAAEVHRDSKQLLVQPQGRRKLCGLSRRAFWIICAVATIVVIGAAIGGGVGGSLSNKSTVREAISTNTVPAVETSSTNTVVSQLPTQSLTQTAQSLTQTAQSLTQTTQSLTQTTQSLTQTTQSLTQTTKTTTVVGPSGTLFVDCPSSNNTVYSPASSTQMFRKICGDSLVNANGYAASVTEQVSTLDDCIGQCAGYNTQYSADIAKGAKSICNAACWRSTGGDLSGWCYGYTTQNSSGAFMLGGDTRCNSAGLINQ